MEEVEKREAFKFTGNAKEYFRIWIVNLALTILTLGIYSAWAKVRTNRYFYANTFLDDSAFSYTANPLNIFYGRLLVVGLYIAYVIFNDYLLLSVVAGAILLTFILALPYLIRQALRFKMRYTSYRNISFSYKGSVWAFYTFFVGHLLLNIVTLGIAFPYSINQFYKLKLNNTQYGKHPFYYDNSAWGVYKIIFISYFLLLILGIVASFFMSSLKGILDISSLTQDTITPIMFLVIPFMFLGFIFIAFVQKGIWDAMMANYVYSATDLDEEVTFKSELSALTLSWIYFSNFFAMLFSLGLLTPWAKIRTVRYKLSHTFVSCEDYDHFTSDEHIQDSAIGEEAADFFDLDVGF